ncbi:glycosyltransferase [Synechococcus sp. CBW1107]|uniref:glycosyltransferase n=1 Tax=Synechococcus sp. CBW1107 TaxID=2789857 RepID=UPI002AD2D1D1|nr:glycosyltransferase [Synechococcus sp. CBW1107]
MEFIGEIDAAGKQELLGHALALLFSIDWPEPFGLVMIKANACGTPVIAWRNGSTPEVIRPGCNGQLVESIEQRFSVPARCRNDDDPMLYPVACSPQAWASGSVFGLLEAITGMGISSDCRIRPCAGAVSQSGVAERHQSARDQRAAARRGRD